MTNRERAMNLLHYKPVDRLPAVHFGYWDELLVEWAEQGKIPKRLSEVNRDGSPQEKLVALPVKDPYHVMRNLILIVELLHAQLA